MKTTLKSITVLLLLLFLLVSLLAGCAQPPTSNAKPTIEYTAKPLIQAEVLGEAYNIDVKITKKRAYLGNVRYNIMPNSDFCIVYDAALLRRACDEPSVLVTMERLKAQPVLYLLETDNTTQYGQKVALYDMNNVYYLLTLDEQNEVNSIHTIPSSLDATQSMPINFVAQTYAQSIVLSIYSPLIFKIEDNTLYINEHAYTVSYKEDFTLSADDMLSTTAEMTAVQQVFQCAKEIHGCYMLECEFDSYTNKIAAYEINGIYYFFNISSANSVTRIHHITPWSNMQSPKTLITARRYACLFAPFWSEMSFKEKDGCVYFNDYLYESVTSTTDFDVIYDEGISWVNDTADYQEKLQSCSTYYVYESSCRTARFGSKIVACQADSAWFFMVVNKDGKIIEIYKQLQG